MVLDSLLFMSGVMSGVMSVMLFDLFSLSGICPEET